MKQSLMGRKPVVAGRPRLLPLASRLTLLGAALGVGACGSAGGNDGYAASDGGPGAGSDAALADGQMFGGEGGPGTGGGGPCNTPGATQACWTGPASSRHVGNCKDGTQTCLKQGEFGEWGPCMGQVLNCGVDAGVSGVDGSIPPEDAAIPSDEAGLGSVSTATSDSCRNLAMAFIPLQFPATVCVLTSTGAVQCGPADTGTNWTPPPMPQITGAKCLAGGENFFCVVTSVGGVTCWGDGTSFDPSMAGGAPFGSGTETLNIPGLSSGVVDIAGGETHLCVRMATGAVKCWGNQYGEENGGNVAFPTSPTDVTGIGGPAIAIATGDGFSCALRNDGVALCWGNNTHGELGNGTTTDSATPVVVHLPSAAVGVWADQSTHPCALLKDGTVWCWGGLRFTPPSTYVATSTPVQVTGLGANVKSVTVGGEFTESCVMLASGDVQCWGDAWYDLGNGSDSSATPVDILPSGSGAVEIRSGDADVCALLTSGAVMCWGETSPPGPVAGL